MIAEVARQVGWASLWDATLDVGGRAVRGLQMLMLSRVMSHHGRGIADPVHGVMRQPFSRQCWTTLWNTIKRSCSWILSLMSTSC